MGALKIKEGFYRNSLNEVVNLVGVSTEDSRYLWEVIDSMDFTRIGVHLVTNYEGQGIYDGVKVFIDKSYPKNIRLHRMFDFYPDSFDYEFFEVDGRPWACKYVEDVFSTNAFELSIDKIEDILNVLLDSNPCVLNDRKLQQDLISMRTMAITISDKIIRNR